jgi:hypothetical protein
MAECWRCAKSAQVPFIRHWGRRMPAPPWPGTYWLPWWRRRFCPRSSGSAAFSSNPPIPLSGATRLWIVQTKTSATITNVFRNRRFGCLFLGLWLGAAVSIDILAAQNFSSIDPFLAAPGSPSVSAQVQREGAGTVRFILRRNAAEENVRIFEAWEWSQIGIATVFFSLILFGERPPISALVLISAMFVIVLLQHFILTPQVVSLGREVDEIPLREQLRNPTVDRFWVFHGFYSGSEIVKLLLGIGVGIRLMIRRKRDSERSSQFETHPPKRRTQSAQNG